MNLRVLYSTFLCVVVASAAIAQMPPGPPARIRLYKPVRPTALMIRFVPRTLNYPPLQTEMPLDVALGYIGMDSLVRSTNVVSGQWDTLLANTYDSDTLRFALKYLYKMGDWDPITFFEYEYQMPMMGGMVSAPYKNSSAK